MKYLFLILILMVSVLHAQHIQVFFNARCDTNGFAGNYASGLADFISIVGAKIDSAKYSIDLCMYDLTVTEITDKLIAAKNRGVKVRVITEDTNRSKNQEFQRLEKAGITVIDDSFGHNNAADLMHNKFMVVDFRDSTSTTDDYLLTGSVNYTYQNTQQDANNLIVIQDKTTSSIYTQQFEQMWGSNTETPNPDSSRFHTRKRNLPPHELTIDGIQTYIYFSPIDSSETKVTSWIKQSTKEIDFCIYAFSSDSVCVNMKRKFHGIQGFLCQGVFDSSYWNTSWSKSKNMRGDKDSNDPWDPPAPVYADSVRLPGQTGGLLHHKYMIIDPFEANAVIITGSTNWSMAGFYGNDENMIIFKDKNLSQQYYQDFRERYKEGNGTGFREKTTSRIAKLPYGTIRIKPQPVRDYLVLTAVLQRRDSFRIEVRDMQGRLISSLGNAVFEKGRSERRFNLPAAMKTGSYVISIHGDDIKDVRLLMVVRR